MWKDALKNANINIHVMATGAGAGMQQLLWEVPGSSAYLSGASFPYDQDEQAELLGFMPEHFCSEEAAIDLASAAYMKAYKFNGKRPVGVGITASVASEKEHRGDHRVHVCVMTNDFVRNVSVILEKGSGATQRHKDGDRVDALGFHMMLETVFDITESPLVKDVYDTSKIARERFFLRPFFAANGKRLETMPTNKHLSMMPGAYNPPHEGHLGTAQAVMDEYGRSVVFEVTAEPPHKEALTVQQLLQRAKLLQGHDRLFTRKEPYYLDKAKSFPGIPMVLGADAMVRMLDPKWGINPVDLFKEFISLDTKLLVAGRMIDGKFTTCQDILDGLLKNTSVGIWALATNVLMPVDGRWDISSTELRNKKI